MTYHVTFLSERHAKTHSLLILRTILLFLALMRPHLVIGIQFGASSTRNTLIKFSGSGKETPSQSGIWRTCSARGISGERDCSARRGGGFGDLMQPAGTCMDISERTDTGSFCRYAAAGGEKWSEHERGKLRVDKRKKISS